MTAREVDRLAAMHRRRAQLDVDYVVAIAVAFCAGAAMVLLLVTL